MINLMDLAWKRPYYQENKIAYTIAYLIPYRRSSFLMYAGAAVVTLTIIMGLMEGRKDDETQAFKE